MRFKTERVDDRDILLFRKWYFLEWRRVYHKVTTFDGDDYFPVEFSITPETLEEFYKKFDRLEEIEFEPEKRKGYYYKTIFGFKEL